MEGATLHLDGVLLVLLVALAVAVAALHSVSGREDRTSLTAPASRSWPSASTPAGSSSSPATTARSR